MAKKRFTFSFKYQNSTPHMLLLSTFGQMRPENEQPSLTEDAEWHLILEESLEKAVERFRAMGSLVRATPTEKLEFYRDRLTIKRLKTLARSKKLPVSGSKDVLIQRLLEADEQSLYRELPKGELLRLSDKGQREVDAFLSNPKTAKRLNDKRYVVAATVVLSWLLKDALIPELLGSAVYDLLTEVNPAATRELKGTRWQLGRVSQTYVTSALKLEWCFVPAGYFLMGSRDHDPDAYADEKPQHRVYLPAYYLGKYPITNQQYQVFVQSTGHREPRHWENVRFPPQKIHHPVTYVSWSDAIAFCQWASQQSGIPIRLLTEAEWEKGARGVKGQRCPWGNQWQVGYSNTAGRGTSAVDQYAKGVSPYGAYDMIGNVWEWTSSLHKPYPYHANDGRESLTAEGSRVARGTSYRQNKKAARAAYRFHGICNYWNHHYGFRVGWSAPSSLSL